jgi:hypothetical protein
VDGVVAATGVAGVVPASDGVAFAPPVGVATVPFVTAVAGVAAEVIVAAALGAVTPALVALGVVLLEPPPQAASNSIPTSSIASFFTLVPSIAPTISPV